MNNYNYPYNSSFPPSAGDGEYHDHGDGFGHYYGMSSMNPKRDVRHKKGKTKQSEDTHSRSRSLTRSKSRSKTRSRSGTRSQSSCSQSSVQRNDVKKINWTEPKFIDAFRVLYLKPRKTNRDTAKYLSTKKKQDRIQELLKSDRLGSKHWLFYPRPKHNIEDPHDDLPEHRDNCDKRIKVDGDYFRKCKRSKNLDTSAPIAKLKRWELMLYKKLGFIQAV